MNKICVFGSINMDLVVNIDNIPRVGETILSKAFNKIPGGKGANQAVAAKRCGSAVSMIGNIGNDENGEILKSKLIEEKIDVECIFQDLDNETGMAFIMVNESGNNSIIVIQGSNMTIKEEIIEKSIHKIRECDILISQFETCEKLTLKAFKIAKSLGKITVLNPAPAKKIDNELLKYTDIIIPNETETEVLTGISVTDIEGSREAAKVFLENGVKFVIITLGDKGAALIGKNISEIIPAYEVDVIDTTAAGDSFIGALSSKLNVNNISEENLIEAITFANKVSSVTVQRKGAQTSIPYLKEVERLFE